MADSTYSVKLSDEIQERIRQLVEDSGSSNKEFFTNLIAQYELEKTKAQTPIISQDIAEIQQLTKRIDNIFIGIGERINTLQGAHIREIEESAASNKDTIQLLQQRINTLEHDRLQDEERIEIFISEKEAVEIKAKELLQQVEKLEATISDKTTIIEEYKQKNDKLNSIVVEYKEASEYNKELLNKVSILEKDNNNQALQVTKLNSMIDDMKKSQEIVTISHKKEVGAVSESITDKLTIQHEKAILKLEAENRKKQEEQQARYNEKINLYEDKVHELLKEIEQSSNKKNPKSSPKPLN